jgi:hypothetical protein
MNFFSDGAVTLFKTSVRLLNQPIVKEGVKNIAGVVTFGFGLVEIYDVYRILQGREITSESDLDLPKWIQVAHKVVIVSAKISLILSAGVSRPGVFIISSLMGCVFSTGQLNRVFGPNTIFAVNPWHPRHVVSIAAVILALPSHGESMYQGIKWVYNRIRQHHAAPANLQRVRFWLTDTKIRLMSLFNTLTSRPVLHLGNQLGRMILRPT